MQIDFQFNWIIKVLLVVGYKKVHYRYYNHTKVYLFVSSFMVLKEINNIFTC